MNVRRTIRNKIGLATATVLVGTSIVITPGLATASPQDNALAARDVPAGFDLFETDPQQTAFQFQGSTQIPAGFFGPGTSPFAGTVKLGGIPLNTFAGHDVGDADTVVQRTGAAALPGPGSSATVPIEIVALSLQSVQPITVQVGPQTELWDVRMGLSPTQPSRGTMTIRQDTANGGTFDSQLLVQPLLTFSGPGGATRTWDLGGILALKSGFTAQTANDPWSTRCQPPALGVPGVNDAFCPGLEPTRRVKKVIVWTAPLIQLAWVPAQPRLEHYACYQVKELTKRVAPRRLAITDQFGTLKPQLRRAHQLCNPAQKNSERWQQRQNHLKCYQLKPPPFKQRNVVTRDQFGSLQLNVRKPSDVCMPTLKKPIRRNQKPSLRGQPNVLLLDRFVCYNVTQTAKRAPISATIRDQFGRSRIVVYEAVTLCNPARVNKIISYHPIRHLVCYRITHSGFRPGYVQTSNQFGREVLKVTDLKRLCVPALKVHS